MNKHKTGHVGSSPLHLSGIGHVTGKSVFIGDTPPPPGMLILKILSSPIAHGKITRLDPSLARALPGVQAIITAKEIPGRNQIGAIIEDETLLADGHVMYVGEPIAIIAATDAETAFAATRLIELVIEELPPLLTIADAKKAGSRVGPERKIESGNPDEVFKTAPHVLTGTVQTGPQEHFYLETQRARAWPEENGAITIHSSTQNPHEVQRMAAQVLGFSQTDIHVEVKRLGGGFGGKEAQATSWGCLAALAAHITHHPCELILSREEDMVWTGKRHPFENHYRIAFDDQGRILAYDVELNSNAGAVADVSTSVLSRSMFHAENAYHIPHIRIVGHPHKTNIHPSTAFRGFGAPQGIFTIEVAINRLAFHLGLDPLEVRRRNLYHDEDLAPYGAPVTGCILEEVFGRLKILSDWDLRKKTVAEFNSKNAFLKKGLGITPVKFGISFTAAHLNQASALVLVYADGSVSVSHGAIEMGQEVNTKIAQIVATALGISIDQVRVEGHSTKRIANATPTSASSGADLNGHAAEDACRQILARLKPLAASLLKTTEENLLFEDNLVLDPENRSHPLSFKQLVKAAHFQRIDLSAKGHYTTPGIHFDFDQGTGHPFHYFVYGAAVCEITLDLLTGRHKTDGAWIVHDSGKSLNPEVDIGQIHGAFMQGLGWCTFEELVYSEKGQLLTTSPTTYKIPAFGDDPAVFIVELIENNRNDKGLKRSKANGEPPLIYGEAVFFAIVDALASLGRYPDLSLPLTPERVLFAVRDSGASPSI